MSDDFNARCDRLESELDALLSPEELARIQEAERKASTMKVATFVKKPDGFQGDARLYRLVPPMPVRGWDDEPKEPAEFVIVSANNVLFSGPETYIFKATEAGEVADWGELDGSFRGGLDHVAALRGAGYEIATGDT